MLTQRKFAAQLRKHLLPDLPAALAFEPALGERRDLGDTRAALSEVREEHWLVIVSIGVRAFHPFRRISERVGASSTPVLGLRIREPVLRTAA